jgi:hypothetical protein
MRAPEWLTEGQTDIIATAGRYVDRLLVPIVAPLGMRHYDRCCSMGE